MDNYINPDSPVYYLNNIDFKIEDSITEYINNVNNENERLENIDLRNENSQLRNENTVLKKLVYNYVLDIEKLNNRIKTLQKEFNKLNHVVNKNRSILRN